MIYLDSAATTFQKPAAVQRAVVQAMRTMTPTKRLLCLIRIFKHQADDVLQLSEINVLAFQTLDVALGCLRVFRIEHDQIPKESNISSAV